jgi:inner membrane protein involved in colicin E2 resistance
MMGTALLFLALGVIMLATRKINWYKIGLSTSDEVPS